MEAQLPFICILLQCTPFILIIILNLSQHSSVNKSKLFTIESSAWQKKKKSTLVLSIADKSIFWGGGGGGKWVVLHHKVIQTNHRPQIYSTS